MSYESCTFFIIGVFIFGLIQKGVFHIFVCSAILSFDGVTLTSRCEILKYTQSNLGSGLNQLMIAHSGCRERRGKVPYFKTSVRFASCA